jgi:hypothetical protein
MPARTVAAAVFASTGQARLLAAGPAAAASWQAGQYRRRDPAIVKPSVSTRRGMPRF